MASQIQYQDPTMQLLSQLLGSKTTTSRSSSSDPAATAALQQLLAQMQQSSTPEGMAAMMAQLFQTGAQQVPALTQQYANAAGARTTGNSSLQLALGDLNSELAKQAAQLAMTQQQNTANVANQLAGATRTQTQTQKQGVGGNPLLLAGAGMLLNQANKRGWIDKIGDTIFGPSGGADAAAGLSTPEYGSSMLPQMTSDAFSIGQPMAENTSYLDFGGITDAVSDFGNGLLDYGSDLFSGGGDSSLLDDEAFDMFFADGGMPSRGRTDMGARTPATLQGALQVSDAQAIAAMIQQAQQQAAATPITGTQRENKEGQDSQAGSGFNDNYSTDALGYAQSALKANSFANMLGMGIPGMGPISGLVNAQSPTEAVNNMIATAVGMVNPLAGLAAKYALAQVSGSGGYGEGYGDRGPGGSSGEAGAVAGGASPRGPGDYGGGGRDRNGPDGGYGTGARDSAGMGNMGGGFGDHSGGGYGDSGSDSGGDSGDGGDSDGGRGFKNGGVPGGRISGPGNGTSDSIKMPLANVSNGEYIVSADVVNAVGPQFFDMLQAAFHKGGKPA